METSRKTAMFGQSYPDHAEMLLKNYMLSDPVIPYTSVLGGILACKLLYDFVKLISTFYFRSYSNLTKIERIEWNNRGVSTLHAIFISVMSLYFVFWSNIFSDQHLPGVITLRSSPYSTFTLGVSVGYFLSDLGMICWLYPSLGGLEYDFSSPNELELGNCAHLSLSSSLLDVFGFGLMWSLLRQLGTPDFRISVIVHHSLSGIAVAYSVFTGEGQLYTFMVLISESTTPGINMRWYLDTTGLKRSSAYLINGVVIFFSWLVARILLFIYMFHHVYIHYEKVVQMHAFGYLLVFVVPLALGIMNLIWFGKIVKGLAKMLGKKQ